MDKVLLELKNVVKAYGLTVALNSVSLQIFKGESLGLVGESGSGKSTLARTILGLIKPDNGEILYGNVKIDNYSNEHFRRELQIVFQDPQTSLNPTIKIGDAIAEPIIIHKLLDKFVKERVSELLLMVGLKPDFANRYPHELSGGERQRVGIARALALNPKFIVLDEPVSALDLSIQVQILDLLKELKSKLGLTYLFIAT